jgi:hypothetical protein
MRTEHLIALNYCRVVNRPDCRRIETPICAGGYVGWDSKPYGHNSRIVTR